jgi:hypothetical protein
MYPYCTFRSQVTSASVAHLLRQKGFNAFVIDGGLAAWRRAGNPLQPVPETDLVHLPTSADKHFPVITTYFPLWITGDRFSNTYPTFRQKSTEVAALREGNRRSNRLHGLPRQLPYRSFPGRSRI